VPNRKPRAPDSQPVGRDGIGSRHRAYGLTVPAFHGPQPGSAGGTARVVRWTRSTA
jgi:hypothetical protein